MSDFSLVWSFRNRVDVLTESIWTANNTCPQEVHFQLIDAASTPQSRRVIHKYVDGLSRSACVCETPYRSSLSEAWNLGMMLTTTRYVIIVSSDVSFSPGWFEAIVAAVEQGGEYILLQNHAVFCLDKKIIPRIGWFDEGFGIGAHFDPDYMIRASEKRVKMITIPNDGFYVHDKEELKYTERVNMDLKDRLPVGNKENEDYFQSKWESNWPGWEHLKGTGTDLPHPPTNVSVAKRKKPEVDQHPSYTEKLKCIQ